MTKTHRTSMRTAPIWVAGVLASLAIGCGGGDEAEKQRPEKAGRELPSAIDDRTGDMTSRAPSSTSSLEQPEPAVAEPTPEPAPEPGPETYAEHVHAGKRLAREGERERAIELFEAAVQMRSEAASPRIELARAYLDAGKPGEARAPAEEAVELAPDSSYAWNTLGRAELMAGDHEAAIASFERATEENEDNSYAWNNLGLTFLHREEFEAAAGALERATSGASPRAYMWNNLGLAYEHLDRLSEARAAYRQAADDGSAKAAASLERLEGVVSLMPDDELDEQVGAGLDRDPK